ncbi:MarR family winged helix-turn-helix transcriptional regulator [Nocardioides pakistanensis]
MTPSPEAARSESLLRIERELGSLIHRVRRRTVRNAAAVHPDLLPAAFPVLMFVVDHDGVRAADVVDHFGVDKGSVSRHVVHLQELGLVSRACDPEDRRAQTIVATGEGRARVAAARAARREEIAGQLSDWTAADLGALADALARYNAALTANEPSQP